MYLAPGAEKEPNKDLQLAKERSRASHLQQDLLAAVGGDVRAFIALYRRAQEGNEGPAWLKSVAQDYRKEVGLAK